jgi:hypothetical protein
MRPQFCPYPFTQRRHGHGPYDAVAARHAMLLLQPLMGFCFIESAVKYPY